MAICPCGHNQNCTANHPIDKEQRAPSSSQPVSPRFSGPPPPMNGHRTTCHQCEETHYPSLLPPSHELDGCRGFLIYFTRLLLHLTQLNPHHATCPWCDEELPYLPTPQKSICYTISQQSSSDIPPSIHDDNQKHPSNYLDNKPTFRVYTKAKRDYSLTIRDGRVVLAPSNPSDPLQHWIKDEKFGINMKDEQGFPSFALVNKATGQAMKYPIGVQLTKYNPNELDVTVLWSNDKGFGDGYRQVRPVDNIHLKLDAGKHIQKFGGVHDGAQLILWEWNNGHHQKWTIFPY